MNYADLQVTTHFSFLRGVSSAEELFSAAAVLGVKALGVVDRNSLAGMVRAQEAAKVTGVRLNIGCRLSSLMATHEAPKATTLVFGGASSFSEPRNLSCVSLVWAVSLPWPPIAPIAQIVRSKASIGRHLRITLLDDGTLRPFADTRPKLCSHSSTGSLHI